MWAIIAQGRVHFLAVSTVEEALKIRQAGITEKEAKIFEKLALRVISGIGEFDNTDRFEGFPKECITEKVLLEAIKKQPLYLNYADKNRQTFKKLAEMGYKKELEEQLKIQQNLHKDYGEVIKELTDELELQEKQKEEEEKDGNKSPATA